jgi:hypothetical protein
LTLTIGIVEHVYYAVGIVSFSIDCGDHSIAPARLSASGDGCYLQSPTARRAFRQQSLIDAKELDGGVAADISVACRHKGFGFSF